MSDEEEPQKKEGPGIPAWVMTFADLMSLLMCFFVLLLSFSEMDALKYKRLAGSMAEAFGVQNRVNVNDIPKGSSVIAQEFSPGRPEPTPVKAINQLTMEDTKSTIENICESGDEDGERSLKERQEQQQKLEKLEKLERKEAQQAAQALAQALNNARELEEAKADAQEVEEALKEEINGGKVEVESRGKKIIIRIKENGSFPSGSATLRPEFLPIMEKMRQVFRDIPGHFFIEGHTDDVPISTSRFRSNWELSSSRAVSVAHELFRNNALSPKRVTIIGHADTHPLLPNTDSFNRAKNRRVEIIIEQGDNPQEQPADFYESDQFDQNGNPLSKANAASKESEGKKIQAQLDTIEERQNVDQTIREAEAREKPKYFEFSPDEIF